MQVNFNKKPPNRPKSITEKKRRLLIRPKAERLIEIWRIVCFSSISFSLGFLFINNGWTPIKEERIHVKGSPKLGSQSILEASGLTFPKPLLSINPTQLQNNLINELPIKAVSIRRLLLPPGLQIETLERKPIAFANRRGPNGQEKGMLDINGYWMPLRVANKTKPPKKSILVEGWMSSHRKSISKILKNRFQLGSPLKKITLNPNGELNLQTNQFSVINLGINPVELNKQIKVIRHLSKRLPSRFRDQIGTIIDLRDPSKPELQEGTWSR